MTIDEELLKEVFQRVVPGDLDEVLTTIEAYRLCVSTVHKLEARQGGNQRRDVEDCARGYEKALAEYAASGCRKSLEKLRGRPKTEFQTAHMVSLIEW